MSATHPRSQIKTLDASHSNYNKIKQINLTLDFDSSNVGTRPAPSFVDC